MSDRMLSNLKSLHLRVDMVADTVIKTIEDDTLAGKVVTVTQQSGAKTYEFPKAKF